MNDAVGTVDRRQGPGKDLSQDDKDNVVRIEANNKTTNVTVDRSK